MNAENEARLRKAYVDEVEYRCGLEIRNWGGCLRDYPHAKKEYRSYWKESLQMYQEALAQVSAGGITHIVNWPQFRKEHLLAYPYLYGEEGMDVKSVG